MIHIKGNTANELFVKTSKYLIKNGNKISPRGLETKELNDVFLELQNPLKCIVTLKSRNISYKYLKNELRWYLSGSLNVNDINKHSSFWSKLADTNGTINSNYGFIALKDKYAGKSQLEWCIDSIKKDINTRQAVINYNQPKHKYPNNKDFVCTLSQQFIVRDNKLDSIVFMRSNDLIFGLTYDMPWFCLLMKMVARECDLKLGYYKHYAASLHVYKKHYKMLKDISKNE